MFSCFNLITQFIVYVAFSHVYFWRQKFSLQTHMVRKTVPENRVDLWRQFLECASWVLEVAADWHELLVLRCIM